MNTSKKVDRGDDDALEKFKNRQVTK